MNYWSRLTRHFWWFWKLSAKSKIIKITGRKYYDDELGIIFVPDNRVKRYLTVRQDSLLDILAKVRVKGVKM